MEEIDTSWFTRDRFGLFLHWGLYSLPARHEWVKHREQIPDDEYDRYFQHFDPDLYDPDAWAEAAAGAGMRYFVITTKHHEGFCLWDSKLTDYKAPNTPAGRDLLRPMVEAFRSRGMRVGFYHSLIDWHHPHYQLDRHYGPYRNHPEREAWNAQRDPAQYVEYLHGQVRELLTDFGPIDLLWFDFSYPKEDGSGKGHEDWQSERLVQLVRSLQPQVLLNDRLDLPDSANIKTPEQIQPRNRFLVDGKPVVWEACQTFSGSWGYHRDEMTWRNTDELLRTLIDCVSKGGNLLLNVGPTGRGELDPRALTRLREIGEWMKRHQRSLYGCTEAPAGFATPHDGRLTYNPETRRIYVHLFAWPYKHLHLDGDFVEQVAYAQLLHDGSEIQVESNPWFEKQMTHDRSRTLTLSLPPVQPNVAIPVIELFLR